MLANTSIFPTLPTTDLQKSKDFYVNKLGLTVEKESSQGILYKAGGDSKLYVYKRPPSHAEHTLASFDVEDIEKTIDELTQKGVSFEQYDFPGLKTNEKGIADSVEEGVRGAWFKDPDGNILAISQRTE
jgi:catechol 2,3-dioxygenase-like lactoylglutathione lyase family enzyme